MLDGLGCESQQVRDTCIFYRTSRHAVGPTQCVLEILFLGTNRPLREADRSRASITVVTNVWSCTSSPPIHLQSGDREHLMFNFSEMHYICIKHRLYLSPSCYLCPVNFVIRNILSDVGTFILLWSFATSGHCIYHVLKTCDLHFVNGAFKGFLWFS